MNTKKNNSNMLLIVLGVVLVGAAVYWFYSPPGGSAATALSSSGAPASSAEQTFINLAAELDPINFPTAIFSNPRFMNLNDTRTSLTPEDAGRPDPFAPLPGIAPAQ